jgi:ubiquinone/menaquinone biosynthesis C-methylase UbiE
VRIYTNVFLPRLCDLAMRSSRFIPYRQRVIAAAQGRVLEIGAGSGLNLPFYRAHVQEVLALEPAARLVGLARRRARINGMPIAFIEASAEAIPLDTASVDTVVTTWTLCSIPHPGAALAEIRRVLKPGGRMLFVEHGASPDPTVRIWQDRLTPAWKRLSGGCHLNRPIRDLLVTNGFQIDQLTTGYMPGPKPMTYMSEGSAHPL